MAVTILVVTTSVTGWARPTVIDVGAVVTVEEEISRVWVVGLVVAVVMSMVEGSATTVLSTWIVCTSMLVVLTGAVVVSTVTGATSMVLTFVVVVSGA